VDGILLLSFFGIRGLGSIYYLAYGLNKAEFVEARAMWALLCATVFASLVIHGLSARPAVAWLERRRGDGGPTLTTSPDQGPATV
jgi:sodium/hydrogen antiporter